MKDTGLKEILSGEMLRTQSTEFALTTHTHKSLFWRPNYLESSAWLEHIPFAFWIIENHKPNTFVELGTHYGASYFAFCQSVERLGLSTACYAVDSWKGDEHTGMYGPEVFAKVNAHNEANYSGFSRLIKSEFDHALDYFTDGSIDLLHIDGYHTFEAVSHDYETWFRKLSDRAIVIFHDTNVRERNFGVFKLFEKLEKEYPTFEFYHGHGLGVVGVGKKQNTTISQFFETNKKPESKKVMLDVFSKLGRGCLDAYFATRFKADFSKKNGEVESLKKIEIALKTDIGNWKQKFENQQKNLAETTIMAQERAKKIEKHAAEEKLLLEKLKLNAIELEKAKKNLSETSAKLLQKENELKETTSKSAERLRALEKYQGLYKTEKETLEKLKISHNELVNELQHLKVQMELERRLTEQQITFEKKIAEQEINQLKQQLKQNSQDTNANEEVLWLKQELEKQQKKVLELKKTQLETDENCLNLVDLNSALNANVNELKASLFANENKISSLKKDCLTLQDLAEVNARKLSRKDEFELKLKQELELRNQEIAELKENLINQKQTFESYIENFKSESRKEKNEAKLLAADLDAAKNELSANLEKYKALEAKIVSLNEEVANLQQIKKNLTSEVENYSQKEQELQDSVDARFKEIASLTKQLLSKDEEISVKNEQIQYIENAKLEKEKEIDALNLELKNSKESLRFFEVKIGEHQQTEQQLQENIDTRFQEIAALTKQLIQSEAEIEKLRIDKPKINASTQSEKDLKVKVEKQINEIASLTKKVTELKGNSEKNIEKLKAENKFNEREVKSLNTKIEAKNKELSLVVNNNIEKHKAFENEIAALKSELAKQLENQKQTLANTDAELKNLTKQLAELKLAKLQADTQLKNLSNEKNSLKIAYDNAQNQLDAFKSSLSWKATAPLRIFDSPNKKAEKTLTEKQKNELKIIQNSTLFDEKFYLKQYPDVANSGLLPALHYLLYGAKEGRNPSSKFSPETYLTQNPTYNPTNQNPIVHFENNKRLKK